MNPDQPSLEDWELPKTIQEKRCSCCKQIKSTDAFQRSAQSLDGLFYYCRECRNAHQRKWRANHRDRVTAQNIKQYTKNHEDRLWRVARTRARQSSIPFTITVNDIVIPENCPVCGKTMKRNIGKPSHDSPSIDKYIPSLGYTPENVWVICKECNVRKQDLSGEEHIAFGWQLVEAFKDASRADEEARDR